MNFLHDDLCKELQAAGIVNESGFVRSGKPHSEPFLIKDANHHSNNLIEKYALIPAYVAEIAFLGPSETAKENARKWFGYDGPGIFRPQWEECREAFNNLDTTNESIEDFLRRTRAR